MWNNGTVAIKMSPTTDRYNIHLINPKKLKLIFDYLHTQFSIIYLYIDIYIGIERDREIQIDIYRESCIYIYIYI